MQGFLKVVLTVCGMVSVALLAALLALRVAIHGREVSVPDLAGLSDGDAAASAHRLGLNLSVENRFFSGSVAPNHVLSQAPAPGVRVRRGWQVRVTESLGAQHVAAPDLKGESERPALLMLSHLELNAGTAALLPGSGPAGVVVAQSPSPGATDASEPRIALLVSGGPPDPASAAYVMPNLVGMTVAAAAALLKTGGLHLAEVGDPAAPLPGSAAVDLAAVPRTGVRQSRSLRGMIATQSPAPGSRVTRADAIEVTIADPQNSEKP